jgi:opacity protein-like surface antigen
MMKKTLQSLMLLGLLAWSAIGAQARNLLKDAEMDVFVLGGGSTLVDGLNFDAAGRVFHSRFEPGYKFTIGASVPYGKFLNIETAYTYGPNNLVVTNTNVFPHAGTTYAANDYIGSLAAVVHAPFSRFHFRPYVEGGVEYDRFSPTRAAIALALNQGFGTVNTAIINHNDKFGFNAGVGVDRKLTKRLSFRIDVRDHVTSSPAFGIPPAATVDNLASFPVSGRASNIVYTAGIVVHLGKI